MMAISSTQKIANDSHCVQAYPAMTGVASVQPFPADGLIPALKPLYNYNWVVGFAAALIAYWGLTALSAARRPEPVRAS